MDEKFKEKIRQIIQKCVRNQQSSFIIMPMGKWGRVTKEILNTEFNIQERFCIDNELFDQEKVFSIKNMPFPKSNDIFLNVVCNPYIKYFLHQELNEKYPNAMVIDVFGNQEISELFLSDDKIHLDFMCVGFPKCGTTSLDAALRENEKIYLPAVKETQFFWNINEETHKYYKQYYPANKIKMKVLGAIEPTYRIMPDYVFRYYGKDLKVIFCVRNPANALYSYYKMSMCLFGGSNIQHIKKFENITAHTFDIWARENKESYQYSEYIKNFLNYYPQKQIKILISEELFKETKTQMDQLQEFIGLQKEERMEYDTFPHKNRRTMVSKDYSMALINKEFTQIAREIKYSNASCLENFYKIKGRMEGLTLKTYNDEILISTYNYLMNYYMRSIHELEEILGRSLKNIWY